MATKRSPPNSSACHVQDSAENEQRAKPHQEHSRLSIHRRPAHLDSSIQARKRSGTCIKPRKMPFILREPLLYLPDGSARIISNRIHCRREAQPHPLSFDMMAGTSGRVS
jgi:hypothetical protein